MNAVYHGKQISNGIAIGRISVYYRQNKGISNRGALDSRDEIELFYTTLHTVINEFQELYRKTAEEAGYNHAQIFEAYRMLLEDPEFQTSVEQYIIKQSLSADEAVSKSSEELMINLKNIEDPFFQERKAELDEVYAYLVTLLKPNQLSNQMNQEPSIIVAEDLSPGELMRMNSGSLLGIILKKGTEHSHMAILTRAKGIPALIQSDIMISPYLEGKEVILDAEQGSIILEPELRTIKEYQKIINYKNEIKEKQPVSSGNVTSLKGRRRAGVAIYANASSIEETYDALQQNAEGIGLFRSEYLFLGREDYPSEEEQFQVYKSVGKLMEGRRVVLRTMDIGADKQAEYFHMDKETNPALGYRGIRISLDRRDLFKTQLRAILRASAYGKIDLMLPMIVSCNEVIRTKQLLREVKEELDNENLLYDNVRLGVMIETPAAVMISDLLALEADFFSIGTNDLTQYTLAVDRLNPMVVDHYDSHHPALLRMIKLVVENAHKKGKPVAICGELAADLSLTRELVHMGIDELSVLPGLISTLRGKIMELE